MNIFTSDTSVLMQNLIVTQLGLLACVPLPSMPVVDANVGVGALDDQLAKSCLAVSEFMFGGGCRG